MKIFFNKFILIFLIFSFIFWGIPSTGELGEYTVKAVFLEKFTRFIEWESNPNFKDTSTPFYITVIGENPFDKILEDIYSSQKIKDKPVEIRYISKKKEIFPSHLLFISSSMSDSLSSIIQYTKDKAILTIGDTQGYAKKGVLINFYIEEEKVSFEINETAFKKSGLSVSYMLLNLGKIVEPVEDK